MNTDENKSGAGKAARGIDAEVAEKVMKFERFDITSNGIVSVPHKGTGAGSGYAFCPSTDPAADYSVLCHVRETFSISQQRNVSRALLDMWRHRNQASLPCWAVESALKYTPGDYSRAALAALSAKDSQ